MKTNENLNTFYIHTLGCKTNQSESDDIFNLLIKRGFKTAGLKDGPDFVIVNTCTVTSLADKKVRQLLSRIKKESPDSRLIVTGCFTYLNSDFLKMNKKADLIISNEEKLKIPELITKNFSCLTDNKEEISSSYLLHHSRAFIKVQDGCQQNCTYCIVPLVRGGYSSTDFKEILERINVYVKKGFGEAVITGIHIGCYGIDLMENESNLIEINKLALLLEHILKNSRIRRLRLSSIEINEIDDDLIEIIKNSDGRIAKHFHIPLQSGSDRILKAMKRNYNTAYFIDKVLQIRSMIPAVTITTDIIAGFPGESDDDFNLTLDLLNRLEFSKVHVFKYSRRTGTEAASMQQQVSEKLKTLRSLAARDLSKSIRRRYLVENTGKLLEVVCESFKANGGSTGLASGVSENYIKVYFDMENEDFYRKRGNIIRVKTEELYRDGVKGTIAEVYGSAPKII